MCAVEADKDQSLAFYTLTYNDDNLPVALFDDLQNCIVGFERGIRKYYPDWYSTGTFRNMMYNKFSDGYYKTPSLMREDVKNWFKKFRSYCDRHGIDKNFHFSCFGEYGEAKKRPHYHVLVTGLPEDLCRVFSNMWIFGYSHLDFIPRFNMDGSDAFILTSNYVSKYIAKKDKLPCFVKDGFAEMPRRQSSIGFGKFTDEQIDKLRPFLSCGRLQASSDKYAL